MFDTFKKFGLISTVVGMTLFIYSCQKIDPAKIDTGQIQEVTASSAKAIGNLIDLGGGVIEYGHCWSTTSQPSTSDYKTSIGTASVGSFTSEISGLDAGVTYYIRAYAVQEDKVVYGSIESFNTSEGIPQLTTSAISKFTISTVSSGGEVTADGGSEISARGVCWNTSGSPTLSDDHTSDGTGIGSYDSKLTDLTKNVTIYIRAYATTSYGTGYGNEVEFTITVTPGSDLTDSRDGKVYKTAQIGSQLWMAENLNVGIKVSDAVGQSDNGVIEKYSYDNDESNSDVYGGLYLWDEMMQYTEISNQGVCPDGWHVSSDEEWQKLEMFLGMADTTVVKTSWRGDDEGGMLKEVGTAHWVSNVANNESGFTALPGGRYKDGIFEELGTLARFWTSSGEGTNAWYRGLAGGTLIGRNGIAKASGRSVRCIKDQ